MTWRLCDMSASELRSCTWEPSSNSRRPMNSSPDLVTLTPERSSPRCRSCNLEPDSGQRRCKGIRQALFRYRAVAGFTPVVPERSRFVPTFRRHCERSRRVTWRPVISPTSFSMPARRRRLASLPNRSPPKESHHRRGQLDSDSLSAVHGPTETNIDGLPLPLGSRNPVPAARLAT
jgi:hypothetical protein